MTVPDEARTAKAIRRRLRPRGGAMKYRPTRSNDFEIEPNSAVWVCGLGGATSLLLEHRSVAKAHFGRSLASAKSTPEKTKLL